MPTLDIVFAAPTLLLLLCLAAFFVGLSKGGLPGVGMLSVPVLALTMSPVNAAVLLLPLYILSDIIAIWLYRKEFSKRNVLILIPAGLIGVLAGWATASLVSDDVVALLIGVMGILFCLNVWFGQRLVDRPPTSAGLKRGLIWGALSGFTSFVSHAGAPPYQIYMLPQKLPKMQFAGTTAIVFTVINLAKFPPYAALHPYSSATITVALSLLPLAVAGAVAGKYLIGKLPEAQFYLLVQIALFIVCIRLVYAALMSLG